MTKDSNKPKTPPKSQPPKNQPPAKSRTGEQRKEGERERTGSRTVERRKVRERERRRQQLLTGGIILVALVVIAVIIVIVVNTPADAPIPSGALTRYDGLAQSRTTDGYPRLGDPNVPVQVAEYSSFDCPHCKDFHDQAMDQVIDRVRSGAIGFTFVPLYGTGPFANGQGAAAAAMCAADQKLFWPVHDALFDWQGQFGNQAFTNNRIASGVGAFKMDKGAYNACVGSSAVADILNRARTQAAALLNYTGTPTITINGVVPLDQNQQPLSDITAIIARIDEEIARNPAKPPTTGTQEATGEATAAASAAATQAVTPEATAATPSAAVTPEVTEASALAPAVATAATTPEATAASTPAS